MADPRQGVVSKLAARFASVVGLPRARDVIMQFGDLVRPPSVAAQAGTTSAAPRNGEALTTMLGRASFEMSRVERYTEAREIEDEVPELARAGSLYNDFIYGQSADEPFEVKFASTARPEVVKIVEQTVLRLNLKSEIPKFSHQAITLGDAFAQLVYHLKGRDSWLDRMTALVPETTTVWKNEFDQLDHYEYRVAMTDPIVLQPFEVIHYAPFSAFGASYGASLYRTALQLRRRHEAMEDVTAVLGLTKAAGDTYWIWPFPAEMNDSILDAHLRQAEERGQTDIFFDSAGRLRKRLVSMLSMMPKILPFRQDAELESMPRPFQTRPANISQQVEFLKYLQDRLFVVTGVPKALVGLERDVNSRSTLEQQGMHFAMTIRKRQAEIAQVVANILLRAIIVSGYEPIPGEFYVEMPEVSPFDDVMRADVLQKRAQAVNQLVAAQVPVRLAMQTAFGYDDETTAAIDSSLDDVADPAVEPEVAAEVLMKAMRKIAERSERVRAYPSRHDLPLPPRSP